VFNVQPWGPVDHLVRAVGGRDEQVLDAITEIGPRQVADLLAAEIETRWDPPFASQELPVALHLQFGDELHSYRVSIKDGQLLIEPGAADNASAEIRFSLIDLARLLYVTSDDYASTTREVIVKTWPMGRLPMHRLERMLEDAGAAGRPSFSPEEWAVAQHREGADLFQGVQSIIDACSSKLASMDLLSRLYGTGKWGSIASFAPHYESHFRRFRLEPVKILEIGIGGYDFQSLGGDSLYLWQRFFPRGLIYGMDMFDKPNVRGPRIRTIKGDQSDPEFLDQLGREFGPFDVIIDDGSHINDHVRTGFESLFPHVRPGGYFVIEDFETSYWPEFGGELPPGSQRTSAGLIKDMIDQIHFREVADIDDGEARKASHPSDIHVYHNLVFLGKGMNHEQGSPKWVRESAKKRYGSRPQVLSDRPAPTM
jgi:mycinamicin biosynthesis methyltransferase MycE-like protein